MSARKFTITQKGKAFLQGYESSSTENRLQAQRKVDLSDVEIDALKALRKEALSQGDIMKRFDIDALEAEDRLEALIHAKLIDYPA